MKHRSTTPVSTSVTTRIILVAAAFILAVTTTFQMTQIAKADPYQDKINALQGEIGQYQAEANKLSNQAKSLQTELASITNDMSQIQARVDLSQATYDKLVRDISDNEQKIAENREVLGDTIASLYVDDKISPLEMLASSSNIGDYVDKQSYRSSIRDTVSKTIEEIKVLKKKLESQKIEVARVLEDQKAQHKALADKESERQAVLAATQGQEAAYNKLSSDRQSQVAYLREQQRIAFAAIRPGSTSSPTGYAINYRNWSGNTRCGGGYDYCQYGMDSYVDDPWGLGLTGECVHYTADWLENHGYRIPYKAFGGGRGNANQWISTATNGNFGNVVGDPQYGDVAYMAVPGVGHVGIVEENYHNGWVRVSQYNFAVYGDVPGYSTMDLQITSATQFLRFSK